ncbi:MAG TPA: hypothetical protein VJL87_05850, partial [Bdellovibrionota bacterium]|nr:hypothetical protein [Bdellovibrionota bacterium]
ALNLECSGAILIPAGQETTIDLYYTIAMSAAMNDTGEIAIIVINETTQQTILRGFPDDTAVGKGDYLPEGTT